MPKKIKVSMAGCCLVDRVYNNVSFSDSSFSPFLSKRRGDGGLLPGKLVFKEEFEEFCQKKLPEVLEIITKGRKYDKINIGGPGIVPLIHVSQILSRNQNECYFYGFCGKDDDGEFIRSILKNMNLSLSNFSLSDKPTPSTIVLSDPNYDNGHGERIFINSIGAAWDFLPKMVDESFFCSEIVCFGGTALVPRIHDNLTHLLQKAKQKKCITVVNTVYDFRNETSGQPWPLVDKGRFNLIDLLIMDREEALKISGESKLDGAASFFKDLGVSSFVITNGAEPFVAFSDGRIFKNMVLSTWPVSEKVATCPNRPGDTTGCGDNFAGGLIASLAEQLSSKNAGQIDMYEALSWAVASGGYACYYIGGTYFETLPGEKRLLIEEYRQAWLHQTGIKTSGHA